MKTVLAALTLSLIVLALAGLSIAPAFSALDPLPPTPQALAHDDPTIGRWKASNSPGARLLDRYPYSPSWAGMALPEGMGQAPQGLESNWASAQALENGSTHTCALTTAGGVKCWGDNYLGQLGDGTATDRQMPVDVLGLQSGVVALSSFHKHTCALTSSGGVKCWGYNRHGELGNGTITDHTIPADVAGLTSGVVAISAGGFHSCALLHTGAVKCWGANWHGQVGDGTTKHRLSPVDVQGLDQGVIAIATGKYHSCAIISGVGVKCWGYNWAGQIGNGGTTDEWTPVKVAGVTTGFTALALGELHTCVRTFDGRAKCWGDNSIGQLGDGTTDPRLVPGNAVDLDGTATSLHTGTFHTCARMEDGGAKCWGDNWAGQLGDNTNTHRTSPVEVWGLTGGITAIETGSSHTCAVDVFGRVRCWGSNSFGQLGDGTSALRLTPVALNGVTVEVAALAGGGLHTCALAAAGGLKCWGNNSFGQLGDGTTVDRLAPVDVAGLSGGVAAVASGGFFTCARTHSGGVKCWGDNSEGQLGDGSTTVRLTPVDVAGLTGGVSALAAGYEHACALTTSGGVKCWGNNWAGQLGDGTKISRTTPVDVIGLGSDVVALKAGESHTCALTDGGGVKCWGYGFHGQLGDGTTTNSWVPVDVVGLSSGVIAIETGIIHTCALTAEGGVYCWGGNSSGQLGDGSREDRLTPVGVVGLSAGIAALGAGGFFTCAQLSAGTVQCWGDNWVGQIGDGTTVPRLTPTQVVDLPGGITALAAGTQHACVLVSAAPPRCWGANGNGQIGDGTIPWELTPVAVLGLSPAQLRINFTTGQPGSFFTLTGLQFAPNSAVSLTVNGYPLSPPAPTDSRGNFEVLLSTTQAGEGRYILSATAMLQASAAFLLAGDAPLRPQEIAGPAIDVPPEIAYLYSLYLPRILK